MDQRCECGQWLDDHDDIECLVRVMDQMDTEED